METLTEGEIILTPQQQSTHITRPFTVTSPAKHLVVEVQYSPKFFEDATAVAQANADARRQFFGEDSTLKGVETDKLSNLISFSIDSPEKWLGTAHRHNPKQTFRITKYASSRGFIPCPITTGEWELTFSVLSVATPQCVLTYKVTTEA